MSEEPEYEVDPNCKQCKGTGSVLFDSEAGREYDDCECLKLKDESKCLKCKGEGFHHGFGEHGHDPDWCTECGGSGLLIEKNGG